MRVSPAAYPNRRRTLDDALEAADQVTAITHDHAEGIKGARATAHANWLACQGTTPDGMRRVVEAEYGYDISRNMDEIRPDCCFDESCQGTVPEAITCVLEASSFEDAVRNAISLGVDADTLAAIAGPVAESLFEIPAELIEMTKRRHLSQASDIAETMERLYERVP